MNACPYRKSNPNILMMKPTKEWNVLDAPDSLHCPADRKILAQRWMCSGAVILVSTGAQYAPEMPFAKYHDMIEAFPPDRAEETLQQPFCQGDCGAVGRSRMPNARSATPP
jgi:hypothetical protein